MLNRLKKARGILRHFRYFWRLTFTSVRTWGTYRTRSVIADVTLDEQSEFYPN